MRQDGYEILACDISNVVVDSLSANKKREMLVADAYKLPFSNGSFDVILDKGTLDALSCDKSRELLDLFEEIYRVLRPSGKYIVITSWNAQKRSPQLEALTWRVQHEAFPMSSETLTTRWLQLNNVFSTWPQNPIYFLEQIQQLS